MVFSSQMPRPDIRQRCGMKKPQEPDAMGSDREKVAPILSGYRLKNGRRHAQAKRQGKQILEAQGKARRVHDAKVT